MKPVYIFDAIRTPIGNFGGSLSKVRADDLATIPLSKLMERNPKTDWEQVEDVILGCANQAGEDNQSFMLFWDRSNHQCLQSNFSWRR